MDDMSPEELQAKKNALEQMGSSSSSSEPQWSGQSATGNDLDPSVNNMGLQKSLIMDRDPNTLLNPSSDTSQNPQSQQLQEPPKPDPYANEPYAPPMVKRLFPNGTPMLDPSGGGGLVMGEARAIAPMAKATLSDGINLTRVRQLLSGATPEAEEGARVFGDDAKTALARKTADNTAEMADAGMANANDVQRTTEQMNRQIAQQERTQAQRASRLSNIRKNIK